MGDTPLSPAIAAGERHTGARVAAQQNDWPRALISKMALLLLIKLIALGGLWWWFFSPSHRPPANGAAVASRFLSESKPASSGAQSP
ncbi:cytochrome oxidase putative small subunit CydP [Nevskia soli]|uniref:cytochrome oxidase putative small subunit CydP n=1 Tax=Nevskia soli TaxID=418856 RepID=UPI0004A77202|nr:cytochrome oxidase putative small subunit CydP [Nevskia soli]